MEEINHFSHIHQLRLMKDGPYSSVCNACEQSFSSEEMYECQSCEYRLDRRCTDLPQKLLNPYHLHTLYYAVPHQGMEVECNACGKLIPQSFYYRCRQGCNLNLDVKCAFHKPTKEDLHHFSHFHPLKLSEINVDFFPIQYPCALCKSFHEDRISMYVCENCNFYANRQCALLMLPREIQFPSHECFLTLGRAHLPLHYRCENCKFTVEFDDAVDYLGYKGNKQLQHFSHRHPLELIEQNNEDGQLNCSACGKSCSAPSTYGCIACQYFLHQTCIDLPLEINHFFHPCPLFLRIQLNSFSCGACDRTVQGFYFHCEWCNFSMDIVCALLPTRKSQCDEEQFCHLSHGHPLILSETKYDDQFYCSLCRRCIAGPAFGCRKCSFFLDKSCFDHLRPEIQYDFHPSHPLVPQGMPTKVKPVCNMCCKNLKGPTCRCELCDFEIHMECSLPTPIISYQGHKHLLFFLENIDTEVKCNSCDTACDSYMFHCVECDFNLHLMCGPLPCTIKPECHHHPFILTDSPLEDESDQFYCDVCEKERDPRLPVYNCKECLYPAEIKCVMAEVVLTLKGDNGDAELRTLFGQIKGKLICRSLEVKPEEKQNSNDESGEMKIESAVTLDDMLASFSDDENIELKGVLLARRRDTVDVMGETSSDDRREDSEVSLLSCSDLVTAFCGYKNVDNLGDLSAPDRDGKLELSLFSDRAYKHFIEKLGSNTHYSPLKLWDGKEQVVKVRGNLITQKFVPILNELYAKDEGFSAESALSPRVKNYFTLMLCGTLHSMSNTRILDISGNLLLNWWNNLETLKFAGFKVQFALDHLAKVMHTYFGLQVEKSETELNKKITNISAAIAKLTRELKELKETRECIELAKSSKSDIIKDCLIDASTMKWRPVGTGLN